MREAATGAGDFTSGEIGIVLSDDDAKTDESTEAPASSTPAATPCKRLRLRRR